MGNMCVKYHRCMSKGNGVIVRKHLSTDGQKNSHGETRIPPQLCWRGVYIGFVRLAETQHYFKLHCTQLLLTYPVSSPEFPAMSVPAVDLSESLTACWRMPGRSETPGSPPPGACCPPQDR